LQINNLDLSDTQIPPDVLMALLKKLNPQGDLNLSHFDLSGLTHEHVASLPDELQINNLDLRSSQIPPDVLMALLAKLKPQEELNLYGVNLSGLTHEHVASLPYGLQINNLDLSWSRIPPDVLMALNSKLRGLVHLIDPAL
jgi:hypothetical protein